MTFDEWWVASYGSSKDADGVDNVAEQAWNAALDEAIRISESTRGVERFSDDTITLITTELEFLKS